MPQDTIHNNRDQQLMEFKSQLWLRKEMVEKIQAKASVTPGKLGHKQGCGSQEHWKAE